MATEAIKIILGIGKPLIGRLLVFDSLAMRFSEFKTKRDPNWGIGESHPTVPQLLSDYETYAETAYASGNGAS